MVKINEEILKLQAADAKFIAFEYFPPRTDEGVANLVTRMGRMKHQDPLYVDVTWGAGGSTSDLTFDLVSKAKTAGMESNMHLTCTNMDKTLVDEALEKCKAVDIRNIVALRGDPPAGEEKWEAKDGDFTCALDLVTYMRKEYVKLNIYIIFSVAKYLH